MASGPHQSWVGLQRQVFISHTGADEQGRLFAANVLKPALEAAGMPTFMDYGNLQLGRAWPDFVQIAAMSALAVAAIPIFMVYSNLQLGRASPADRVQAAASSAVFVAVLTRSYATRFWCLRELDLALNRPSGSPRPLIIPVYMDHHSSLNSISVDKLRADIERSINKLSTSPDLDATAAELCDLRRLASDPAHLQRMAQGNLVSLQSIQGLHRQDQQQRKDEEWQMARQVVASALLRTAPRLSSPVNLVGFEQQQAELFSLLTTQESGVTGMWLHGAGGTGKTTMAKLLFDALRPAYDYAAAVELDVVDMKSNRAQQQQHLEELLKQLAPHYNRNTPLLGVQQQLADVMTDKPVLLLIDNISTAQQLTDLLPALPGEGSCIIITSRQAPMPLGARNSVNMLHHQMGLLDNGRAPWTYSRQLFRQWSRVQHPTEKILEIEDALLQACGGVPLALKVIGGQLKDETDVAAWQAVHDTLVGGGWSPGSDTDLKLQDTVWHSFSGLPEAAQNIFLDCVSFVQRGEWTAQCVQMPLQGAKLIWDASWGPQTSLALQKLQDLAFISITEDPSQLNWDRRSYLFVLEDLRLLGQSILHGTLQPGNGYAGSRICTESLSPKPVLGKYKVTGPCCKPLAISLIDASGQGLPDYADICGAFACDFTQLQVFIGQCMPLHKLHQAQQLRWLKLLDCSCDVSREDNCCSGTIDNYVPLVLNNLAALEVHKATAAKGIIDSLMAAVQAQGLPHLQRLVLSQCCLPASLPAELGALTALTHMDLSGCSSLTMLPQSLAQLTSLQCVNLSTCSGLSCLPGDTGKLTKLVSLDVSGCTSLTTLPHSLGELSALEHINLAGCSKLSCLPDANYQLIKLVKLDLSGCSSLTTLPQSVGDLSALQHMDLSGCSHLSSLPDSSWQLTSLLSLDWTGCSALLAYKSLLQQDGKGNLHARFAGAEQCTSAIETVLAEQAKQSVIHKLATEQETMLTTLERMSWLVLLLATATFVAFMQPPGGFRQYQVLSSGPAACSGSYDPLPTQDPNATATSSTPPEPVGVPYAYQACALFLFFIF